MFNIQQLSTGYDRTIILNHLNLIIPKHKITTIIGPNGSGKSTLLKSISRYLKPIQGSILIEGKDITHFTQKDYAKHVAILPQVRDTPSSTVTQLVSHGRFPHVGLFRTLTDVDTLHINQAMQACHIFDKRYHNIQQLSGGERQKAYLALTLAQNTDVILLDEPTTFLDYQHQLELLELITTLKLQQKTIIMVLHDLQLALQYSDYLIVLNHGELVASGSCETILSQNTIETVFNLQVKKFIDSEKTYYIFDKC